MAFFNAYLVAFGLFLPKTEKKLKKKPILNNFEKKLGGGVKRLSTKFG